MHNTRVYLAYWFPKIAKWGVMGGWVHGEFGNSAVAHKVYSDNGAEYCYKLRDIFLTASDAEAVADFNNNEVTAS
jgi:hypothetical protein